MTEKSIAPWILLGIYVVLIVAGAISTGLGVYFVIRESTEPWIVLIIYAVLLLVTTALGVFLHKFAKNWNLYDYRCESDKCEFFVYVLLAFVHFFGMGFTLTGVVAGIVRGIWGEGFKGDGVVSFYVTSILVQTLVGILIEVGHLDYTYGIFNHRLMKNPNSCKSEVSSPIFLPGLNGLQM